MLSLSVHNCEDLFTTVGRSRLWGRFRIRRHRISNGKIMLVLHNTGYPWGQLSQPSRKYFFQDNRQTDLLAT